MVMPGDNVSMDVELIAPIAMDEGLRFAIREGGRTVGAGVVASDHEVSGSAALRASRAAVAVTVPAALGHEGRSSIG